MLTMIETGADAGNGETEIWPPPGFVAFYTVTEQIDGQPDLTYDLVLPGTFAEVDISTVRVGRHGGPNTEDVRFRRELYERVGRITVAAGHAEMAMKRLLLVLRQSPKAHFSTVDETWTNLHKKLVAQCDGSDQRRVLLAAALQWGDEQNIKGRRDDVIHAYWWDYSGCSARRSRFERRSNGKTILATLADLDRDAELITDYARRLDRLLGNDWMIARLPGPFKPRSGVASSPLAADSPN